MPELRTSRLLAFAKRLQRAANFAELLDIAWEETREQLGYEHVWFMVADNEEATELRLIEISGGRRKLAWEVAPVLKVTGDRFLEELMTSDVPVIIPDARTDPRTNKQIVAALQNRTLINVPLRLLDKPLGIFGLGTFGDEGCRAPTPAEVEYLVGMTSQITVAASRIRFLDAQARAASERRDLERRLLQTQKLESLGMLAGGIAHDFNNLLTVIMSGASLAQQQSNDALVLGEIRTILDAASRGRDLTRQLLAMSRAQDLSLKPLDLNVRLGELIELARRVVTAQIRIELIAGARLPLIQGDESQLDQVFMNLLINARDAMPDGGRLTIETEQVVVNGSYVQNHPWSKPGRYVLTTVTDTGVGMSKAVLERVFEPFFTTKAPRAGTGLGLAVSYGIVRQHGGMLHCYSEIGVGTTFKVYLPALERSASSVGTKIAGAVPTGNERILVADDDLLVRGVVARILEQAGYRVSVAEDGSAACSAAVRESFDLVIIDVVMPGMPCDELIARMRSLCPLAKILLSSGYTAAADATQLVQQTGLELLHKPYDPDHMLRAIRSALDAGKPAG